MPKTNKTKKRKTPAFPIASSSVMWPKAPEQKQSATRSPEELLPNFPAALIKHTLFGYLDDPEGRNTIAQLAGHPQFELIAKVKMLLQHVAYGEYKEVKAIIKKTPSLLLEKDTVTDYSGRTHPNKTALQLALGAQDTNVESKKGKVVQDGMVELITEHLTKYLESIGKTQEEIEQELETQFRNQLPEGWEQKEAEKLEVDKAALDTMTTAIETATEEETIQVNNLEKKIFELTREAKPTPASIKLAAICESIRKASPDKFEQKFEELQNHILENNTEHKFIQGDKFNFTLVKAIYKFRNHLEPKEPLKTGKHFNLELLVYAAQQYDAKYAAFGDDWDSAKNRMHWQKVFGYIERFVPACDAQIIAQSIWRIIENGKKSERTLKFLYGGDDNFYPLGSNPNWEIGYNCWGDGALCGGGEREEAAGVHETYAKQKQLYGCYAALTATKSEEPLHNTLAR